ncbi:endonuclease/exonuclease/phosphatase family protein [Saccharospirillum mangrovi]|uniref:endonuclease/exonuclease/phosphatase family protein n=1 Tax=Saccharospirillum mangrovi TaxID=2161747 RepID=UPI0013006550|nr:endonuclease/exonuclease/phosphatase family protein [Saccharospirillum mangrovi]
MPEPLRIATFNVALNRRTPDALSRELNGFGSAQLRAIVRLLQHTQADILVLNELDRDAAANNLNALAERWLKPAGLDYPHRFFGPVNTGVDSGRDLVKDGSKKTSPFGFGDFPGQYGMAVLSRWPIDENASRTFQHFLWRDLPDGNLPRSPDGSFFYNNDDLDVLRLSSKSHWDLVINAPQQRFHLLVSHPTPPAFDGDEQRNVHRNDDEIRFWLHYLKATKFTDDQGRTFGLGKDAPIVIAGDLNADPNGGDSLGAIGELIQHPALQDPQPHSTGAQQRWANSDGRQTASWGLRADYLLPSQHWQVTESQVLWPAEGALAEACELASDHRLVWAELNARPELA